MSEKQVGLLALKLQKVRGSLFISQCYFNLSLSGKILGLELQVGVEENRDALTIQVEVCRRSGPQGCLSASTLLDLLQEPATAEQLLAETGRAIHLCFSRVRLTADGRIQLCSQEGVDGR